MSRDLLSIDKWSWKWKELRWWSEWTRRCQVLTNCPRFFQSNNNENNKEKNLGPSRWNRFSWPLISVLFVGWWKESAQVNCDLPFELDWRVFIVTANQGACRWPRLPAGGRSLRCDAWTSSSMTWGHLLCHVRPRWRHRDRWVDDDVADVADVAEGVASWLLWSFIHILLTAECLIFDSFTAIGPVNVVSCYSFPFNLALNLDSIRFDSIRFDWAWISWRWIEIQLDWIGLDWWAWITFNWITQDWRSELDWIDSIRFSLDWRRLSFANSTRIWLHWWLTQLGLGLERIVLLILNRSTWTELGLVWLGLAWLGLASNSYSLCIWSLRTNLKDSISIEGRLSFLPLFIPPPPFPPPPPPPILNSGGFSPESCHRNRITHLKASTFEAEEENSINKSNINIKKSQKKKRGIPDGWSLPPPPPPHWIRIESDLWTSEFTSLIKLN